MIVSSVSAATATPDSSSYENKIKQLEDQLVALEQKVKSEAGSKGDEKAKQTAVQMLRFQIEQIQAQIQYIQQTQKSSLSGVQTSNPVATVSVNSKDSKNIVDILA